jgi:hypothetical protein
MDDDNRQREQRPRLRDPILPPSAIQIAARRNSTRTGQNLVDVINLAQGEIASAELDVARRFGRDQESDPTGR